MIVSFNGIHWENLLFHLKDWIDPHWYTPHKEAKSVKTYTPPTPNPSVSYWRVVGSQESKTHTIFEHISVI